MTVPNNDQQLLAAACAGDSRALALLWERHRRWVAAVLLLHKPRESDVEDLLQDVAATLISKVTSLRDPETFPGWLRSVAVNAARMAARGARRRNAAVERFSREEAPKDEVPAQQPRSAVAAERLRARLASLPSAYAEPLLLRLVHDMPYAQIAQILDLPETTVENRIVRGRRMLRDQVAADAELNDRYDSDTRTGSNDE